MGKKNMKNRQKKKSNRNNPKNPPRSKKGEGKTKEDTIEWDKYFQEYQELLNKKGVYMRDVQGDGNCLYRCVADQIEGSEKNHKKYRENAVSYLTEHKDYFKLFLLDTEDIESYIRHQSKDGSWGGHFELVALSALYNVKFCVHMKDQDSVLVQSDENAEADKKVLHIAYHVGEHYSSIRKIGDVGETPAEEILDLVPSSESEVTTESESADKEEEEEEVKEATS